MCKYNFLAQEWIEVKMYVSWKYLLCFINAHIAFLLCTAELCVKLCVISRHALKEFAIRMYAQSCEIKAYVAILIL